MTNPATNSHERAPSVAQPLRLAPQPWPARGLLARAEARWLAPDEDDDLEAAIEHEEHRQQWLADHYDPEDADE